MAEEHELGLQSGQAPGALAVAPWIAREDPRRLVQTRHRREHVHVEEHVARDERAVALAPEGEVAVGVPRRLEHDEAVAEVVALVQRAGDGHRLVVGQAGHRGPGPRVGRARAPGLHVGAIALADPDRELERVDQAPGAARVIGVAVGQRVGADGVAAQRLDQALRRALGAGVDDDVAEQVGVDPVARGQRDVEDVLGDAADRHRSADDLYRPPMPDEPVLTERLERAKAEDKPVLVSVGYSACHWCHVMEHESFEDEAVAAKMNEHFVNIKVDMEEPPDVDQIYMNFVQLTTGRGGWPMNVFLTPDKRPFYGGTYFPPVSRYNMPSWPQILTSISEAYQNKREELKNRPQTSSPSFGV